MERKCSWVTDKINLDQDSLLLEGQIIERRGSLILINMIDQNLFEGNVCCVEAVRVVQRYSASPSCGFLAYKLDRTSDRVLQHITIHNKFQTLKNTKTQILTYNQVDTQIQ